MHDEMKAFETHATEKKIPAWLVAAMRAHDRIPAGREMTAEAFDALADKVANHPIGYGIAAPK
jgi:hypothetical protein